MSPVPGERALRAVRRRLGDPATAGDEEILFAAPLWGFWHTPWWPPHIFRGYTGLPPAHSTYLRSRRGLRSPRGDDISVHAVLLTLSRALRQAGQETHGFGHVWQEPAMSRAGPGCRLTPWRAGGDGELELMNCAHWSLCTGKGKEGEGGGINE